MSAATRILHNGQVSIEFDPARGGAIRQVTHLPSATEAFAAEEAKGPDIVFVCDERERRLSEMKLTDAKHLSSGDGQVEALELVSAGCGLEVTQRWRLTTGSTWAEATLAIKNLSDREIFIDRYPADWQQQGETSAVAGDLYHYSMNPGGVEFEFAGLRIGEWKGMDVVAPEMGYPFFHNRWSFECLGERYISLTSSPHGLRMPYLMAYHPGAAGGRGAGILFDWIDETCLTYFRSLADSGTRTGQINLQLWYARYLRPGETVVLEPIRIVPFVGHYREMMRAYRDHLVTERGARAPREHWARLGRIMIATTNAFGLRENMDFEDLIPYVDRAFDMNARGFWIGGTWEDTRFNYETKICRNPCCIMPKDDVYTPKAAHGGEDNLRKLIDYIHGKNMYAICWITGGGLPNPSQTVQNHPDWWTYMKHPIPNRDIHNPGWPGTVPSDGRRDDYLYFPFREFAGPDTTAHGWREFWKRSFLNAARLGFDGVFIDSMNPMMPNYRRYPWPGQTAKGVFPLHRETREQVRQRFPPGMFYFPEAGGYLLQQVTDAAESAPGAGAPRVIPWRREALTAAEMVEYVRDKHLSMLPGSRGWGHVTHRCGAERPWTLYHLFSTQMPRLMHFYDERKARYASQTESSRHFRFRAPDDDTPELAAGYRWLGEMFGLRLKYAELALAEMDLDSVSCGAPGVLPFARASEGALSVVLINFDARAAETQLTLDRLDPAGSAGERVVRDILAEVEPGVGRMEPRRMSVSAGVQLAVSVPAENGVVLRFEPNPQGH